MKHLNPSELDLIEIDRALCSRRGGLLDFVQGGWPILDPGDPYVPGWHMEAISEHLEAIARKQINRLLINIPPGTSKSSLTSIFFPAYLWGPAGLPHSRFIGAAHEMNLATRDNRKTRILIESDWFQDRWPTVITSDQNEKTLFENSHRGFRQSCPVASMTGKRGHVVVWDDPTNPEKANSQTERETAIRVFQETLPHRMVDPATSAIIIIMQRLHQNDVSGHILESDLGYEHLMLPMEFEPERKCYTSIGFEDPRTEEGELLCKARFPREVVDRDKRAMGNFATAGQFQQRPAPRGGAMFKRHWFNPIAAVPAGCRWVRGWDLAATISETAARTSGTLVGLAPSGRTIIAHNVAIQGASNEVKQLIRSTAAADVQTHGPEVVGSIPQDPGAGGKVWAQDLIAHLAGFNYRYSPETGDKVTRAQPLEAQGEAGNIDMLIGDWNKDFLDEVETFPSGKFKDRVDSMSRAYSVLVMEAAPQWAIL